MNDIEKYIIALENQIDPDQEDALFEQWQQFAHGDFNRKIFKPIRRKKIVSNIEWPLIKINEAIRDPEKMMLHQLAKCAEALANGTGEILAVRANYGTGILPSLFGTDIYYMDDDADTLPTVRPFDKVKCRIKQIIDRGVPDIYQAFGARTLEMGERFIVIKERYPKIGKYVHIYHPDLQSPMDVCELLWGSRLFLDIMDQPGLVKNLLALVTNTYIRFMKEWDKIVKSENNGFAVHWYCLHRGHIMLRDDSAMNFSPQMYQEFIKPYNQQLLDEFNGGAVHFCGTGDHFIEHLVTMDGVYTVDMSQPHLNDLEKIFKNTIDQEIQLIRFPLKLAQSLIESGRALHGNIHCW